MTRSAILSPKGGLSTPTNVVVVLAIAALVGQLTPIGERLLPESVNSMANSSGPWAMVVFACVYFSQLRGWQAALLALAAFVIMDGCFYVVFDLLGGYYPHYYVAFWAVVAVCVGPVVGLCASWLRSPNARLQEIAIAAPSSILIGEGIFMLVWLPGVSVVYSIASVTIGVMLFVALAIRLLRSRTRILISLALCLLGTGAFLEVYSLLPLVLDKVVP